MHFSCTIAKKFKTYVAHLFPPQVLNTAPPQIKNPIERVSTIYKIDNESVILYLDKTRLHGKGVQLRNFRVSKQFFL